MKTVNLTVTNVACGGCSAKIENALVKLEGVESVSIDVPTRVLNMDYDPDVISLDDVREEVVALGYDIEI